MAELIITEKQNITAIANAVRNKTGNTGGMTINEIVNSINVSANPILQEKTVVPSTVSQVVTPDSDYYGLNKVTVDAIPDKYQDVSEVTAAADEVFVGETIVDASGNKITGTFTIEDELSEQDVLLSELEAVLDGKAGGSGAEPTLQEKTVTPSVSSQTVTADGYSSNAKYCREFLWTDYRYCNSICWLCKCRN